MIIARWLTPTETGIYAVSISLVMLLEMLREFGITAYLVQEHHLTNDKIRAAFSITLLMGWSIGSLLFATSQPISKFYGEPNLASVLSVLSASFFLLPFGAPAMAVLRREFRFGVLYRITVCANVATAIVSTVMVVGGFGPVSMAYGVVVGAATTTLLSCASHPSGSMVAPTLHGWRAVLTFGGQSTAASLIAQFSGGATQLLIGRWLGLASVGLYSRAYNVILNARSNLFGSFYGVAFPALAAKVRDGDKIKEPFLRACALLTGIAWPMYGFLGLMAFPLFRVLYGPQWDAAVPLFRLLILGEIAFQFLPFVEAVLLATGRVDQFVKGEAIVQAGRISLIVLAALHSLEAVCIAETLHYIWFVIVFSRRLLPLLDVSLLELIGAHAKSAVLTVFALAVPVSLALLFGDTIPIPNWLALLVAASGSGVGWLIGVFAIDHALRREIVRITSRLRSMPFGSGLAI
jgi:O-antigen/teichoic acid export membrane protein